MFFFFPFLLGGVISLIVDDMNGMFEEKFHKIYDKAGPLPGVFIILIKNIMNYCGVAPDIDVIYLP